MAQVRSKSDSTLPDRLLNEWHRRGAVIGLLRGERKRVYPLAQFVDATGPMRGIGDVAKIAPDERAACRLRQPTAASACGRLWILLKAGQRDEVIQAGRARLRLER